MSVLVPVTYLTTPDDFAMSRITDLEIVRFGGVDSLVGITRFDGMLQSWNIDDPVVTGGAQHALGGGDVAGGAGAIVTLDTATGPVVLTGGGTDGAFQQVMLAGGQWQVTGLLPIVAGFRPDVVVQQAGAQIVYGGFAGESGIAGWRFDADGRLAATLPVTPTDGPVVAMTQVAGFVYTVDATNRLTGWLVDANGGLSEIAALTPDSGLWIADATAVQAVAVDGVSYLVLAAAGSSSLTVIEVGAQGELTIRDHLLDTLDTRFGGVAALDIVTEGGRSYVIAGGADDGISIFALLPGGHLVALAHIEDTTAIGLDNVSAITARGTADRLDIFVASSSEPGITQLMLDLSGSGVTAMANPAGGLLAGTQGDDILIGGDGDDVIIGGAGNNILYDGAGSDVLTGGSGQNLFILSADGEIDTITNFALGKDRLDLSHWPMLRDISQLTMTITPTGFNIRYGDERLIIHSADGGPIDYRLLTNADVLGGMRLPDTLTPGFAGPATPPPALTPAPPDIFPEQGVPFSMQIAMRSLVADNMADLRGALSGQPPPATAQDRVITGTQSDNTLVGGAGADLLLGRGGNNVLIGGAGPDILVGGAGNDILHGGDGHDLLIGGDGDDWLYGGNGNDVLIGGAGADTFVFSRGQDHIVDFEQGIDRIILDARLWTGLTSAQDLLFVYGRHEDTRVTIDFGNGDMLWIDGVHDFATLADDISLF